jgi:hypothetical protein
MRCAHMHMQFRHAGSAACLEEIQSRGLQSDGSACLFASSQDRGLTASCPCVAGAHCSLAGSCARGLASAPWQHGKAGAIIVAISVCQFAEKPLGAKIVVQGGLTVHLLDMIQSGHSVPGSQSQICPLIRNGFSRFLSNFASGLTLDVLAFMRGGLAGHHRKQSVAA